MSSAIKPQAMLAVTSLRDNFPCLGQAMRDKPMAYLDNAATTQKPQCVIDAMNHYYAYDNSNVHRAVYQLAERATDAYEQARKRIQHFIGAESHREIIFTKGATEAINLLAHSLGQHGIQSGDEIIVSTMEHHANIVPWQQLCKQYGATLNVVPITEAGELDLDAYQALLSKKTVLVAISHVSNVLGTVNPVEQMIKDAHAIGAKVLLDGAQAIAHFDIDVQALDCDFYVFSGHKMFGPTGIGVLYGKTQWLEILPPYQTGGEMIQEVSFTHTTFADLPTKFEAGTPPIAQAVGLGAAVDFLAAGYRLEMQAHEQMLLDYATEQLHGYPGVRLYGTSQQKVSVVTFTLAGVHAHDIASILDSEGVCVRAGHHCAMPLMQHYGVSATARASFAFYNTRAEIDQLIKGLDYAMRLFADG